MPTRFATLYAVNFRGKCDGDPTQRSRWSAQMVEGPDLDCDSDRPLDSFYRGLVDAQVARMGAESGTFRVLRYAGCQVEDRDGDSRIYGVPVTQGVCVYSRRWERPPVDWDAEAERLGVTSGELLRDQARVSAEIIAEVLAEEGPP